MGTNTFESILSQIKKKIRAYQIYWNKIQNTDMTKCIYEKTTHKMGFYTNGYYLILVIS